MLAWMTGDGAADPGRVHTEGRMARAAIEEARAQVAGLLGARPRQVVFTSGATEAVNTAVWGARRARPGAVVIGPRVEHSCVRDSSARDGSYVETAVDGDGRVDLDALDAALDAHPDVALVHCQLANHEVATRQPAAEVARRCRQRGVLCHVDAAAAFGHEPIELSELGADLVSVSSHKLGGPKGTGALVLRRGLRLDPLIVGGDQERARRAGMEDTPAIVGFGEACRVLATDGRLADEAARAGAQTDRILELAAVLPGVSVYGDPEDRLAHIVCLGVDGVEAEAVLVALDRAGIAAHSGSACSSESLAPSPVLEAMGVDANHSLRLSTGWSTTDADIDALLAVLPGVIDELRGLRDATGGA